MRVLGGPYTGKNPLKYAFHSLLVPKLYGHKILQAVHLYATDFGSPFAEDVYSSEKTSVKLNMVYLHDWMLTYHLSRRETAPQWYLDIYRPLDARFSDPIWRY